MVKACPKARKQQHGKNKTSLVPTEKQNKPSKVQVPGILTKQTRTRTMSLSPVSIVFPGRVINRGSRSRQSYVTSPKGLEPSPPEEQRTEQGKPNPSGGEETGKPRNIFPCHVFCL